MAVAGRWLLGAVALTLLIASCGRSDDEAVEVTANGSPVATPAASGTAAGATPTETLEPLSLEPTPPPSLLDPEDLRGFAFPIEGACMPDSERLIPNAPREYRNGFHEGIDFYDLAACARVGEGTPVLAMYGGVVIRADLGYVDITAQQVVALAERTAALGFSDAETLDTYRGRQLWIDHGNGVATRYAHLGELAAGVDVGVAVQRGQVVGAVGESGTPESVTAPGTEMHLHAEVRVGESFLGADLDAGAVRALYERLFGPEEAAPATGGYE